MPGLGLTLAPQPYGAFAVETMDSYGGWIGSPIDYLRFTLAIDGRRGSALLNTATVAEMNARSDLKGAADGDESRRERRLLWPRHPCPTCQERRQPVPHRLDPRDEHPGRADRRRICLGRHVQRPAAGSRWVQR